MKKWIVVILIIFVFSLFGLFLVRNLFDSIGPGCFLATKGGIIIDENSKMWTIKDINNETINLQKEGTKILPLDENNPHIYKLIQERKIDSTKFKIFEYCT